MLYCRCMSAVLQHRRRCVLYVVPPFRVQQHTAQKTSNSGGFDVLLCFAKYSGTASRSVELGVCLWEAVRLGVCLYEDVRLGVCLWEDVMIYYLIGFAALRCSIPLTHQHTSKPPHGPPIPLISLGFQPMFLLCSQPWVNPSPLPGETILKTSLKNRHTFQEPKPYNHTDIPLLLDNLQGSGQSTPRNADPRQNKTYEPISIRG